MEKIKDIQVIEGMPFEEYARLKAMNASTLKHGARSMAALKHIYENGDDRDTDAMRTGRYIHAVVFEPDTLNEKYAYNDDNRNSSKYKKFAAQNEHRTILKSADRKQAEIIRNAMRLHPSLKHYLEGGKAELTITFKYKMHPMKIRIDKIFDDLRVIFDLKTTVDPRPFRFQRVAANKDYCFSLGLYARVVKELTGYWYGCSLGVVPTTPPYEADAACVTIPHHYIEDGANRAFKMMDIYLECRSKNHFPGIGNYELQLPEWAEPEHELITENVEWGNEL